MRVGLVVPHIFMHRDILPSVIFAPAQLALDLVSGLQDSDTTTVLFSPGPVETSAQNVTADLSYFNQELACRNDNYIDLLKKHPFTFVSLARQVQSELIAKAYDMANQNELDLVHIYTNEEDLALPFASLCNKPVLFTHHDPFNFLVKYKNTFPKYKHLNWLSLSFSQRSGMPADTNWVGNIYHGLAKDRFTLDCQPKEGYVAYLGRIIEPKGLHLAIEAVTKYNHIHGSSLRLKIAGKHYAGNKKDSYWQQQIEPHLNNENIEYIGFIDNDLAKQKFLGNADALIVPSTFEEPFGMVMIESLACGTPVIGLSVGSIPEIIIDKKTGFIVPYDRDSPEQTVNGLINALANVNKLNRRDCRRGFEDRFTLERMCNEHNKVYEKLQYN